MKRFILRSVILTAIVAGILFVCSIAYKHSSAYVNLTLIENTDRYETMPQSVDIAAFGASHAFRALRYVPEGYEYFNFALPSQTPVYDLMLMRQYADVIRPGALVILSVDYRSPFCRESPEDFASKQPRYYRILSPENIVDVDLFQYFLQKYFPLFSSSLPTVIKSFIHDQPAIRLEADQATDPAHVEEDKDGIISRHWESQIEYWFPDTNPDMMDVYRQMLQMCRDRGWHTVLITTPYLEEYNDCFPAYFYPVFYDVVEQLCQEFDVPYLDYSHDETYYGAYDWFRDIDHLNAAGAEVFDAQFFSDLEQRGIWPAETE